MDGHAQKNAMSDIPNWQTRRQSNCSKFRCPCLDDHQFKQEELEAVGELVLKWCLYLARIGRPDILWSDNKLARSVTNGLRHVTDDWQDWSPTFITRVTSDNIVTWATLLGTLDGVYSETQILLGTLRAQNQPREESYVFLDSRTFCLP